MVEEKPIEELTFREAMAELDRIVGVLESNSLELEQSVTAYERGVKLIASLKKRRLAFPCEKKPACPLFVSNEQRNRLPNSNGSHVRCLQRMPTIYQNETL